MLVQGFPDAGPAPSQQDNPGPSLRSTIATRGAAFLRFARPKARTGAIRAGRGLLWTFRAALWGNAELVALAGILAAYTLDRIRDGLRWASIAVPRAIAALLIVLAIAVYRLVLVPFHHVALTVVAICVAIEGLLIGRVFVQIAYQPEIEGLGGTVLNLTNHLVSPFRSFEGTTLLRDTGVVEFATLTAMEAYLVATIGIVLLLMFWSEFLHMYRRVAGFFVERAEKRQSAAAMGSDDTEAATAADLSPAS
jgi:hypothetical protein